MKTRQTIVVAAVFVPLVFMAGYAAGQRAIPKENVGQSDELLRTMDLSSEIASTQGKMLRMRKVTLQPGGVLGLHNHVDRPAITYFLQGEVTYHADGKPDNVTKTGGGNAEGRATTHWAENTGTVPAIWVAVDIVPKP
jgi:quercetin dioxygenase-like cupin family protein